MQSYPGNQLLQNRRERIGYEDEVKRRPDILCPLPLLRRRHRESLRVRGYQEGHARVESPPTGMGFSHGFLGLVKVSLKATVTVSEVFPSKNVLFSE